MKKRGFTLIELLIATAIASVIILSLYSAFNTGILSYRKIDSSLNTYESARLLLSKIETDLKNSFAYYSDNSMFKGTDKNLEFFCAYSQLLRIKYQLVDNTLTREDYQNLEALDENAEPRKQILSTDVKEISFEYAFGTGDPDKPYDWQKFWPKQGDDVQVKTLPLAVKINLTMIARGRKQESSSAIKFTKLVSLPSSDYSQKLFFAGGTTNE